jgi:uncharacterized membrane protein YdcZ (DUF606 family)
MSPFVVLVVSFLVGLFALLSLLPLLFNELEPDALVQLHDR